VGAFYGVVRGVFKISTLREDGREGILGVMEQGDWLGEAALLDGLPCPHDATAVQAGAVLLVNNQAFDGLMQRAAFARGIAKLLGSRVRVLYGLVEDGMLRATSTRIARRLLSLVRTDTSVGRLPHVPLSQEALAMMLGLTRQTLSRELKSLAAAGVVALGYRRIEIVSLSDLELLATLD
jgi:CRP-like cAMP-binding protein